MTSYRTVEIRIGRVKRLKVAAPTIDEPMTRSEAAAFLGLSPDHLSRLTAAGDVPVHYLGTRPRFYRDELSAWIRSDRAAAA